jgi:hypothetical protein
MTAASTVSRCAWRWSRFKRTTIGLAQSAPGAEHRRAGQCAAGRRKGPAVRRMARNLRATPNSRHNWGHSAVWPMSTGVRGEGPLPTQSGQPRSPRERPLQRGQPTPVSGSSWLTGKRKDPIPAAPPIPPSHRQAGRTAADQPRTRAARLGRPARRGYTRPGRLGPTATRVRLRRAGAVVAASRRLVAQEARHSLHRS